MGGVGPIGEELSLVETYVPGQNCKKILAPMPWAAADPILAYIAG